MTKKKKSTSEKTEPKFPYSNSPSDLKRLLQLIPQKPKPPKLATSTANTWGIKNTGIGATITVLKEIGLLDPGGVPTDKYVAYMTAATGGQALGLQIKARYETLFNLQNNPQNASNDELRNFFNIHSGGAEKTIEYQIKTFKALCEFASFDGSYTPAATTSTSGSTAKASASNPQIHFDLHIHLPEGKTGSDYESIIRSISEHIVSKIKG